MIEMASSQDANYMYWCAEKQHVMSLEKSGHGLFEGTASETFFLYPMNLVFHLVCTNLASIDWLVSCEPDQLLFLPTLCLTITDKPKLYSVEGFFFRYHRRDSWKSGGYGHFRACYVRPLNVLGDEINLGEPLAAVIPRSD